MTTNETGNYKQENQRDQVREQVINDYKKVRIIPSLELIMACKANFGAICILIMLWKIRLASKMQNKC